MPRFDRPLITEKVIVKVKKKFLWLIPYDSTYHYWVLHQAFRYYDDNGNWIEVPEGTPTDFASTPQFVWVLMPKDGIWDQSAALHDYLYQNRGNLPDGEWGGKKTYTRGECDKVFYDGNKVLGVKEVQNLPAYEALVAFGWYAWKFGKPIDRERFEKRTSI